MTETKKVMTDVHRCVKKKDVTKVVSVMGTFSLGFSNSRAVQDSVVIIYSMAKSSVMTETFSQMTVVISFAKYNNKTFSASKRLNTSH
jgi:hypothetical protein